MTGVYIHIPFCKSRCCYCDFFSTTMLERREEYVQALIKEIEQRSEEIGDIRTIYFGGGTPSLLAPEQIKRIIKALTPYETYKGRRLDLELTLEANPGDLTIEKLRELREAGINRLSIGIQSFNDTLLRRIGRRHNATEAIMAVQMAREAGFDNLSIDLMYGLPGQTLAMWEADIEQALALRPEHISAYCLCYEEGTPLCLMRDRGEIEETDEDTVNEMAMFLNKQLRTVGYEHYEVSNYCQPGRESKHNSAYWEDIPYIGLGAGAHSYDGHTRSWNVSDVASYIGHYVDGRCTIDEIEQPIRTEEVLTEEDKHVERIMLGLRTRKGIPEEWVVDKGPILECYLKQELITIENKRVKATEKGIQLLNRIIKDLI